MKEVLKSKNKRRVHSRRNQWGRIIRPGAAYEAFKNMKAEGWYPQNYKWAQCCKAYRKKIRKMKIARYSRKGMRKHIKRAR